MGHIGRTFWYQLLDIVHFATLERPSLARGVASFKRSDWIGLFYPDAVRGGPRSPRMSTAERSWERWKVRARALGVSTVLAPPVPLPEGGYADASKGYFHVQVSAAYERIYAALGPPHPAGEVAEIGAEEAAEAEAARTEKQRSVEADRCSDAAGESPPTTG